MKVYVYPDGEQYNYRPSWKSDDYEIRETDLCTECDELIEVTYQQPYASCRCGTLDWPK